MEEYFRGLLRSHKGRLLEWGGVRVLNVNEMQAISADFKRQWNKNPTVCVRSYSFYGKGKTYTLVMAYREKDSLMWRDDYAKMFHSDFKGIYLSYDKIMQIVTQLKIVYLPSMTHKNIIDHSGYLHVFTKQNGELNSILTRASTEYC